LAASQGRPTLINGRKIRFFRSIAIDHRPAKIDASRTYARDRPENARRLAVIYCIIKYRSWHLEWRVWKATSSVI